MSVLHDDVFRRLCRARAVIHERHAESLTLAELAREAGISPYHFLRVFRRAFGRTPFDMLTDVRLARAKDLLAKDAPVTDVCFQVGFQSLGSFSALFAREVGHPPSRFRRQMRTLAQVPDGLATLVIPYCFAVQLG